MTDRLSRLLAELAAPQTAPGLAVWEEPLQLGDRLDRFEIRAELGRGGFGAVYEAWDEELGRAVAVKTLRVGRARRDATAVAIKQEAEAVAKLNHPGIVTLHDVCLGSRGYYLVMERLEGTTLAQRIRAGALPWREATRLASDMADALAHAHGRGVLHRDLKPANAFLCTDGRVKLLDFGLAHLLGAPGSSSGGTPAYMAPEQVRADVVDARADVFALGVVFFEMLTGALPFESGASRGLAPGEPLPPMPGAPRRLARLVRRLLARDPADRPADGAAVAAELSHFRRSLERRRWRAWMAASLAVSVAAAVVAYAARPGVLPAGRLVAAVADLDNETGDARFDGVGELFTAALEQSRRVAVMDRGTLLRNLTKGGVAPALVGEAEAIEAARAAAAQLVVVPSLRTAPGGLELAVQVVDVLKGRAIFSERESAASPEGLYAAMDRVVLRVRRALAEDASDAPRTPMPVASFAPANPEALRLYAEGERLNGQYEYQQARARWEAALDVDPSFPLPRLALLQGSVNVYMPPLLDEATAGVHAKALRRDLGRLPESVRPWAETVLVRIEGGYANHTELLAGLDAAIAARPEHAAPYIAAANELLLRRGDAEAARPYIDRALQVSPLEGLGDVLDYLLLTDRLDEALAQARLWVERSPGPAAYHNLAAVHSARGEHEQAMAVARSMEERWGPDGDRPETWVDAGLFERVNSAAEEWRDEGLLAECGRVAEALRSSEDGVRDSSRAPVNVARRYMARAALALVRGDAAAVERDVAESFRLAGPAAMHAWLLAEAGRPWARRAAGGPPPDRLIGFRMAGAMALWRAGEREAALAEFGAIASPPAHLHRGEILAELGRHREAVEAYRRYRRSRHGQISTIAADLHAYFFPRSFYLEAVSLEALGERAEAHEVISRLLRLWAKADQDLPLLAQARALEARVKLR